MEETKEKTKEKKKRFHEGQLVLLGALLPMLYFSVYKFGWKAAELMLVSAAAFYAAWWFAGYLRERLGLYERNRYDLRGLAAGAICFITLSSESNWYVPVISAVLFGGIVLITGMEKVFAPVLFVRFLLAGSMTNYFFTEGFLPAERIRYGLSVSRSGLLWGFAGGYMGEVCAVAILVGAVFLFVNNKGLPVLSFAALAGGFLVFLLISSYDVSTACNQVLTGNFLFVAGIAASEWSRGETEDIKRRLPLRIQIPAGIVLGALIAVSRAVGLTKTGAYLAFLIVTIVLAAVGSRKKKEGSA